MAIDPLGPSGVRPPVDKLALLRDVSLTGVVSGQTLVYNGTTWVPGPSVTGPGTTVDGELVVFSGTTGTIYKRSVGTGVVKLVSGVYSTSTTTSDLAEGTNLYYTDARVRLNRLDQMATPTANVSYGGMKLVNLGTPTATTDAATKAYVDGQVAPSDVNTSFSDITTNNSSTTKHGFLKKLSGNASQYLDGTGNFSIPPGTTGSGTGDFSTNTSVSVDGELVLFSGTGGKTGKRSTGSGLALLTAGVLSTVVAPAGTIVGTTDTQVLTNKKLGDLTTNGFVKTINGDGTLSVDTTAYLTANQTVTLTGDVTGSGATSIATTIAADAVTYAKMQNISATSRVLGRKSSGAGNTEELQLTDVLDFIGSAAQGDVLYRSLSTWARLPAGTAGQVLTTQGVSANPTWTTVSGASGYWDTIVSLPSVTSTSSTSFVDVAGLTIGLLAASRYEVEVLIQGNPDATTGGAKFRLGMTTPGTSVPLVILWGQTSGTGVGLGAMTSFTISGASVLTVFTTASQAGTVIIKGMVVTDTAGTLSVQYLKNTSGTVFVNLGSSIKIKKVA